MKKVYIDFEMNMPNVKTKRDILEVDVIAIGAIQYDIKTEEIKEFKSLIKPVTDIAIYPHIEELTKISQKDLEDAPSYEDVMRRFKKWLGTFSEIEGIYTFGNLDYTCFNNTDKRSAQKHKHPRFINNIKGLFVDIKDKYMSYGIRCMNYISLKNLLDCANVKFEGDAHDPLNDAYNLFILDKTLENNEKIQDILRIQDIIRSPFTLMNKNLEVGFQKYRQYLYKEEGNYTEKDMSIEVLRTMRLYMVSIKNVDIHNIEILKDISKKLDVLEKLTEIKVGYFYLLEDFYLDMKDLLNELMLYRLSKDEYREEIENIISLFEQDLLYENIDFEQDLQESC